MITKLTKSVRRTIVAMLMLGLCPVSASAWSVDLSACTVFEQDSKRGSRTSLPAGPIELPRDETGYAQGYQAQSSMTEVGNITVTVYDCDDYTTAYGLMSELRQSLREDNYQMRFACNGKTCGPPAGWVKLLALRARADAEAFGYTLASRIGRSGREVVAVYAADLDGRPRIIVYNLRAFFSSVAKRAYDQEQVAALYAANHKPQAVLPFALGLPQRGVPDDVLSALQEQDEVGKRWVVVGYADVPNSPVNSASLAWRRAAEVAQIMIDSSGTPADSVQVYALGASGFADAAPTQRSDPRVEIFMLKAEPAEQPPQDRTEASESAASR